MGFVHVPDVAGLNPSDKLYQCDKTGKFVKVRVVCLDDSAHSAEVRANNLFLHVSGSVCAANGKALPDGTATYSCAACDIQTTPAAFSEPPTACPQCGGELEKSGGHCVGPPHALTLNVAELIDQMVETGTDFDTLLEQRQEEERLKCAAKAVAIDAVVRAKLNMTRKVIAPDPVQQVSSSPPVAPVPAPAPSEQPSP